MTWYYVVGTEQKGPVSQPEFEQLVRQGVITGTTLVWREGMAEWQPFIEVAAPPPPIPLASASVGGVECSECGRSFASDQVVRLGDRFFCAACKPIALQRLREGVADGGAEQIRKDHLNHEASLRSVGVLYYLGAVVLLLVGLFQPFVAPGMAGLFAAAIFIGLGAVQLWAGIGLRGLKPWARVPSGILSGLGLLAVPVGTIINAYILYLLFSRKGTMVFSAEYQRIIKETPHIKYRTSILVWVLLGLVLLVIGAALAASFFAPHR